ncbi:MAG: hypothetical protein B7X12_09935 [Halothiobacillus sp. 20-53-49]|nr:MAG: hypothetical protein B7X12_09935 [Halothiobacillus sp. 20-53-49]
MSNAPVSANFPVIEHEAFSLQQIPTPLSRLILRETHLLKLTRAFKDTFGGQGVFAQPEPIVIDLSGIENSGKWVDFPALVSLLRNYKLDPIAVIGGNAKQREQAKLARLPQIESRAQDASPIKPNAPAPAAPAALPTPQAPIEPATIAPPEMDAVQAPKEPRLSSHDLHPPLVIRHPVRSFNRAFFANHLSLKLSPSTGFILMASNSPIIRPGASAYSLSLMPKTKSIFAHLIKFLLARSRSSLAAP